MDSASVSTKALAEATGIPRTTLVRRLTGNSSFTVEELELIAQHFGSSAADLMVVAA